MTEWTSRERIILNSLSTPPRIQAYLNTLKYNIDPITRSPRFVMKTKKAHCFDGALFAAAALEFHGDKPLLVDMRSNKNDDDHVLAVYERHGRWGSVAKSNFATCRGRDPVYASLRELIMSYFDGWFNLAREKTLREFSKPFDLRKVKDIAWRTTDEDLDPLGFRLDAVKHYALLKPAHIRLLSTPDDLAFKGATLGTDVRGAFKVRKG
jgi:hypothetical protein